MNPFFLCLLWLGQIFAAPDAISPVNGTLAEVVSAAHQNHLMWSPQIEGPQRQLLSVNTTVVPSEATPNPTLLPTLRPTEEERRTDRDIFNEYALPILITLAVVSICTMAACIGYNLYREYKQSVIPPDVDV